MAAGYGLKNLKESLKLAETPHVEATENKDKDFKILPRSCSEAAENLEKNRHYYEADGVFPNRLTDETVKNSEPSKTKTLGKICPAIQRE
jgi:glutamine synthetase